jgi:dTDP-4-amino-4,6-dideoxygalactose transaminase
VDAWNEARRHVARRYDQLLEGMDDVIAPHVSDEHVFHQYTVRITNGSRDAVQDRLKQRGINTMIYYPVPQDRLPMYAGQHPSYPVSDRVAREVLSLPIWPEITLELQKQVMDGVRSVL